MDLGVDSNCFLPSNIGSPLKTAVLWGNVELIKILLQAGADVNTPGILCSAITHDMRTPHGISMFQFMLNEGADYKIHGEKVLRVAAHRGYLEAVRFLVLCGVDVNAAGAGGNLGRLTVLQNAVSSGNIGSVKILLDAGADINAISFQTGHQTAPEIAVGHVVNTSPQKLEMVQVPLAAGADVNFPKENRIGASILQSAISKGDGELISLLLKEGADVNSPTTGEGGRSPVQAQQQREIYR